jgi:TrmH family RNA methyltransferase
VLLADSPALGVRSGRVAAARRLLRRSTRRSAGRFLVEGPQALSAAVERGTLFEVFATEAALERHQELASRLAGSVPVQRIDAAAAAALSDTVTPQGIVGVAAIPQAELTHVARLRLVCVLVEPRDPGNVGTIIRTADAAGADAVVLTGDSVDPFGGKAVRASAGSVFALPIVDGLSTEAALRELTGRGARAVAADGYAHQELDEMIDTGALNGPVAWLFGNEAHGLSQDLLNALTVAGGTSVRVPVYGSAESLNLAAAVAVCLYASARAQRRPRGEGDGG